MNKISNLGEYFIHRISKNEVKLAEINLKIFKIQRKELEKKLSGSSSTVLAERKKQFEINKKTLEDKLIKEKANFNKILAERKKQLKINIKKLEDQIINLDNPTNE